MKHIKYIAYISLFLLASCSTTKNLPEGEVLYTGIKKIEVTNEDKSKEGEEALTEIEAALAYPFAVRTMDVQCIREQKGKSG